MPDSEGHPVVLLYEDIHPKALALLQESAIVRMAESLEEDQLLSEVADVEGIIIRANGLVSARLMAAAPRLKVVGRHGTGIEAIDLKAAAARGIVVVNTPEANVESVAEHAIAMMLTLAKRIGEAERAFRAGEWGSRYRLTGVELQGRRLGLVGLGRIGSRLAEIARQAFDMQIVYSDLIAYPRAEAALGAQRLDLEELLSSSDVVSIHVPLLPATRHLIDEDALKRMKPEAFLINTARGPVVDQAALQQALEQGWIAGAGLDVHDPEPLPADHPILALENVVVTPHMAAHTDEALLRMALVVEDILAVIEGKTPRYPVPLPQE